MPSSPVHATFTFMAGGNVPEEIFKFINPRTVHVYALLLRVGPYRKLDARSIIIRQLKTATPRVRLFSAATSARDVRVTMEITWQFKCFS